MDDRTLTPTPAESDAHACAALLHMLQHTGRTLAVATRDTDGAQVLMLRDPAGSVIATSPTLAGLLTEGW